MACKYIFNGVEYKDKQTFIDEFVKPNFINQPKTLRVQEYQSDEFQKLANRFEIFDTQEQGSSGWVYTRVKDNNGKSIYERKRIGIGENHITETITSKEHTAAFDKFLETYHPFLALLHKNDNWITFGIKAIIQNAAKKGYEKVLFPTGNTASKVEGHTTLEEFKKQKEDRIKDLEKIENEYRIKQKEDGTWDIINSLGRSEGYSFNSKDRARDEVEKTVYNAKIEINQLKQELKRVETEGFGALKPIYNFYENTVTNILNKTYGKENVKLITDEYGNTWNEITIEQSRDLSNILLQRKNQQQKELSVPEFNELQIKLKQFLGKYGFSIEGLDEYIANYEAKTGEKFSDNPVALIDLFNRVIAIDSNKMDETTLPEEVGHLAEALLGDHPLAVRARELVSSHPEYEAIYEEYYPIYRRNNPNLTEQQVDTKVRREAVGKLIAKELINQSKQKEDTSKKELGIIDRFVRVVKKMIELFFNRLNKATELNTYISEIANNVLLNNQDIFDTKNLDNSIFYQNNNANTIEDDKYVGPIGKAIKSLEDRIKKLRTDYDNKNFNESTDSRVKNLKEQLKNLKKAKKNDLIKEGATIFTKNAKEEIKKVNNILFGKKDDDGNILTTGRELSDKELKDLNDFIAFTMLPLKQLRHAVKPLLNNSEEDNNLIALINDVAAELMDLNSYYEQKLDEHGILMAENLINKEDSQLSQRGKRLVSENKDSLNDYRKNKISDVGSISKLFGELRSSSNHLLNSIYEKIDNTLQIIKQKSYNWAKSLIHELGDLDIKKLQYIYEKDENGKNTGYFIRPQNYNKYFKEKTKFFNDLYKKYKLSLDTTERNEQLKSDKKLARLIKSERKKWYDANTDISIEQSKIPQLISQKEKKMTPREFRHWLNRNFAQDDKTGDYYLSNSLGDFRTPKMSKYRNADWNKISSDKKLLDFYNKLIDLKAEIDSHLPPTEVSLYRMPQLSKTLLDRFKYTSTMKGELKEFMKEKFLSRVDDTDFGNKEILRSPDGNQVNLIPIFYTQLLEDVNDISPDLIGIMIAYKEMQTHYSEMSKVNPDIELTLSYIRDRLEFQDGKEIKKGAESNTYAQAKSFVDAMMYHTKQQEKTTNLGGLLGDKKLSVSKLINNVAAWVRHNNLVGNFFTAASATFSAESWTIAEGMVEEFVSRESLLFSQGELVKEASGILQDTLSMKKKSKVTLLMELSGITGSAKELFRDFDKSKTSRGITEIPYSMFSPSDYKIKGTFIISLLHDTRLVNGEWISKREYLKRGLNKNEWSKYETAYEKFTIENGVPKLDLPQDIQISIFKKARSLANKVDGQLTEIDKGAIHRMLYGQFLITHRNWMIRGIQDRMSGIKYDSAFGTITEGTYRTIGRLIMESIKEKKIGYLIANWNNLEDFEKKNVFRVLNDMATLLVLNAIGFILQAAAGGIGDDDDWAIQSAMYVTNRLILEQAALMPFGFTLTKDFIPAPTFPALQELTALMQNPLAAATMLRTISDLSTLFNFNVIESGKYEGMTGFTKTLIKVTPGVNGTYNSMFPASKNKWLTTSAMSSFYWIE